MSGIKLTSTCGFLLPSGRPCGATIPYGKSRCKRHLHGGSTGGKYASTPGVKRELKTIAILLMVSFLLGSSNPMTLGDRNKAADTSSIISED